MSVSSALNISLTISIISLIVVLIGIFLIARWIYYDAKSRGINPLPWTLITIIISPNIIGLIMYILTRPKSDMLCNNCKHNIAKKINFCPNCGEKTDNNVSFSISKTSNKSLSWGLVLFVIFSITLIIGTKIHSILPERNGKYKMSCYEMSSVLLENQWENEFKIIDGTDEYFFEAKNENSVLVYSSEITFGNITFEVYSTSDSVFRITPSAPRPVFKTPQNEKDSLIETISSNTSGEITNLVQGKKYKVVATTDGVASGKFSFEMK